MQLPQLAGFGVTTLVAVGIDLPVDWLVLVATSCGGLAMFAVACALGPRR